MRKAFGQANAFNFTCKNIFGYFHFCHACLPRAVPLVWLGRPACNSQILAPAGWIFAHSKLNKILEGQWQGKNARQKIFLEFIPAGLRPQLLLCRSYGAFFHT